MESNNNDQAKTRQFNNDGMNQQPIQYSQYQQPPPPPPPSNPMQMRDQRQNLYLYPVHPNQTIDHYQYNEKKYNNLPPSHLQVYQIVQIAENRYVTDISSLSRIPVSTIVRCPKCDKIGPTEIILSPGSGTFFCCLFICLFSPCCFLPFILLGCQDKTHFCFNCETELGTHRFRPC